LDAREFAVAPGFDRFFQHPIHFSVRWRLLSKGDIYPLPPHKHTCHSPKREPSIARIRSEEYLLGFKIDCWP
jgi:hypothetical protein